MNKRLQRKKVLKKLYKQSGLTKEATAIMLAELVGLTRQQAFQALNGVQSWMGQRFLKGIVYGLNDYAYLMHQVIPRKGN
ncbi:MAG: hypothetical protein RR138_06895 [Akkermansia sp.]